jgi:hypothetical protein
MPLAFYRRLNLAGFCSALRVSSHNADKLFFSRSLLLAGSVQRAAWPGDGPLFCGHGPGGQLHLIQQGLVPHRAVCLLASSGDEGTIATEGRWSHRAALASIRRAFSQKLKFFCQGFCPTESSVHASLCCCGFPAEEKKLKTRRAMEIGLRHTSA